MKRIIYALFAVGLLMMGAGCTGEESQHRLTKAERDSLRRIDSAALKIGVLPVEACLPIVVAEQLRLYDTLGVTVHLRRYHALSECRIAVEKALVEGAVLDTVLIGILNKNTPVAYAATAVPLEWKLLTAKKARVTRLDQLVDKIIAADSHGITYALATQVLDTLRRKKQQAFVIQVEDLRVREQMLVTGNVDAAFLPEPFASRAEKSGAKVLKLASPSKGESKAVCHIAYRTEAMKDASRRHQQQMFEKAVGIAADSIRRYGKEKYMNMMQW